MAVNTLITSAEIDSSFKLIDCRFALTDPNLGQQQYNEAHIEGAQYAHLNNDLSGVIKPDTTGRHPLPNQDDLIGFIQSLGIENADKVVAYDDGSASYAARLWWMLRGLGHEQVWVLDGGINAWQKAGGAVNQHIPDVDRSNFAAKSPLTQQIDADQLLDTNLTITDARDATRFRGEVEPIDSIAGHIPGAINLPFIDNLEPGEGFKSAQALADRFRGQGISETESTICYCGSGVTACNNILALVHAGYPEPTLYPGSWSEWITQSTHPIATGD